MTLRWKAALAGLLGLATVPLAHAADITWTGAADSSWHNAANWDGGVPGPDDIAIVPLAPRQPLISEVPTLCAGVVLEEGAALVIDSGNPLSNAFYVIGDGDLDNDEIPDARERDESDAIDDFDADDDGIPNFAERDSDNDGMSDTCEFAYPEILHPYFADDGDIDSDGDGFRNGEECSRHGDPTDPGSHPLPVSGVLGLSALCLVILVLSVRVLRKAGPRTRHIISLLFAATLLAMGGYLQPQPILAASMAVDFALGHTIETAAANATDGDTLEINGDSMRPWNGQSTYVIKPLTLLAVDGPVFLGGMRTTFQAGVLGEGKLEVTSAYTGANHPSPISEIVTAGSTSTEAFLGEWFTLVPTPEAGWGFHGWADDATGTASPLSFQAFTDGLRVTAVFGPPGPDLAATVDTGPPSLLYAGDTVTADILVDNIGQSDTPESSWADGLYLSRDTKFDAANLELDVNTHTGAVDAGDDYTASFSATLPDVAPGVYYILGVADVQREATDENRNNNVVAASVAVLDFNLAQ